MEEKRHTSREYERELQEIKNGLLYLGAMTERAIDRGVKALLERDSDLARQVICDDDQIDKIDVEIEEKCIRLLALRQPAARDLRFITTAIKINGHLERIGDMASNIAEKAIILNEVPQIKPYIDLPRMADIARSMIKESLDSLEQMLTGVWNILDQKGIDREFLLSRSLLSPATCCLVNPDAEKTVEKAFRTVKDLSARLREKFKLTE